MSFGILALVGTAALLGPLLALPHRWRLPVVVGELAAGIVLGPMLTDLLTPSDPTVTFLADVGFALVMFVAGSHVPVGDARLRGALPVGLLRAALVGAASVPVAVVMARVSGTGHAALYTVLLASSSAALVLPIGESLHLRGPSFLALLPQVAVADAVGIAALPLVIDPAQAATSAVGAIVVVAGAGLLFVVLRAVERRGWRKAMHDVSQRRGFALELRVNLALLFTLAAVAQASRVSVMLAGFSFGLVVAAVGEPRRLVHQLFAVTEGFFGPVFFVWLGASLDLRALAERPALVGLGLALGLGAVLTHLVPRLTGQPVAVGALAAAQLGVPVAAAALGTSTGLLDAGEPAALMLGALLTIAVASVAAERVRRAEHAAA
ncbi:cation:proton antiporter [Actinotalea sp.]|uniref:cation:proton antiporter n=1 Tax=Actinotalea sp. TaxID=1872145 RepID=UPI002C645452|nr:cation:proton antiporter [Actinotalea sp.]HRA50097.1 cation:proton antiporter [Actinotalea sp.]